VLIHIAAASAPAHHLAGLPGLFEVYLGYGQMIHGFSQLAWSGQIQPYSEQVSFADLLAHLDLQLA
jgi:hypothetical protein